MYMINAIRFSIVFTSATCFLYIIYIISLKIQRYSTAAVLYDELGFRRKAGFFTRIAAMQCVSQQLPHPLWPLVK